MRDWFRALDPPDRQSIGRDISRLQYRWPVGMPLCRSLGAGLWEVRSNLPGGRTGRVLFCFVSGKILLLHAFIKKSRKAPTDDLDLARARKREFEGSAT